MTAVLFDSLVWRNNKSPAEARKKKKNKAINRRTYRERVCMYIYVYGLLAPALCALYKMFMYTHSTVERIECEAVTTDQYYCSLCVCAVGLCINMTPQRPPCCDIYLEIWVLFSWKWGAVVFIRRLNHGHVIINRLYTKGSVIGIAAKLNIPKWLTLEHQHSSVCCCLCDENRLAGY